MSEGITPSQTVGPFLAIGLPWPDGPFVVPDGTAGSIVIEGQVLDGAGQPVPDALVETWQADPDWPVRSSRRSARARLRGTGRLPRVRPVGYRSRRELPHRHAAAGPAALPGGGGTEAPHLDVSVFARGLLDRVVTRIYSQRRSRR